jgi:hypothetical protein
MARLTKETRLLALLADGEWHDARELSEKVSHRFGGYLFTLKNKYIGRFSYEMRQHPKTPRGQSWTQYRARMDSYLATWARDQTKGHQ